MKTMVLFVSPIFQLRRTTSTTAILTTQAEATAPSLDHLRTLCKQGCLKEALNILHTADIHVDSSTYVDLLQRCIDKKALSEGRSIHTHINQNSFKADRLLHNTLINMYVKCGSLADARRVFDQMTEPDVFSWTVMISGYGKRGFSQEALNLFNQMRRAGIEPNQFTFASVLPACGTLASLKQGIEIHEEIVSGGFESDVFVMSALVDMYAKCGSVEKARDVFDKMCQRNAVSWTVMITAYARHGPVEEALSLFFQMRRMGIQPNRFSFASVLPAVANLGDLEQGVKIHEEVVRAGFESDTFVMSALVDMYAKCGSIERARELFNKLPQRDVVSWTAMITGYAQNGLIEEAAEVFRAMPHRDDFLWTAMIAGYAQNGLVDEALGLFIEKSPLNVVAWTAMIAGFAQNGRGKDALRFFQQMQLAGVKPDSKTLASVLPACANSAALEQGMEIHEKIITKGFLSDLCVVNALIDMYAKCGSIQKAREVFDKMHQRDLASCNSMMSGYAMHGLANEVFKLFEEMKHSGIRPDHITLVGVLSACSRAGLVDEGYEYFNCMSNYYNITPVMEHYSCMVDLLGRAGLLYDALNFIKNMPIKADASVWSCLLGACRIHNNIELGEVAAEHVFEMDSKDAGNYVLLSNIYAAAGRWDDIEKVRKLMKDRGVKKTPGYSWIEVNKQVHAFLVGDKSHPQIQEIYMELVRLSLEMKMAGYVANTRFVLNDGKEENEQILLNYHSERLAIAFGLLNTTPGTTIRVIKNLRVCVDCHTATKFISKIAARDIVVRDANRYHHFKDGHCSCGDYW